MKKKEDVVIHPKEIKSKETEDLKAELESKKKNLQGHLTRLSGGVHQGYNLPPIDEEIDALQNLIQKQELERAFTRPLNPRWEYETNSEWIDCRKKEIEKVIIDNRKVLVRIFGQKEKILKEIPEFKARINEIEKKLELPLTQWAS